MKSFLTVVLTTVALGLWLERDPATLAQPAAAPAKPQGPLRTPYTSERQWAVQEIAGDIQEMAGQRVAAGDLPRDQHPGLLDASVPGLFAASEDVSKALKRNGRNPRAHESAAMVLGAFGLLEAADDLSDHRWVMNRMTAHLAVAAALRGAGPTSTDGRLAAATLATLANRQSDALDMLARFGDAKLATPIAAWQRVLLLRINQDWRVLSAPAKATRLEKLAYLRASA